MKKVLEWLKYRFKNRGKNLAFLCVIGSFTGLIVGVFLGDLLFGFLVGLGWGFLIGIALPQVF